LKITATVPETGSDLRRKGCAPSRIRTCGLLLRSTPAADAVANWDDAGQVRGGTHCCSPSYLVIASRALAPRSPPRMRYGSHPRRGSQPAYRPWPIRSPARRPEGSRSAASPEHSRRRRAGRVPSRPRSHTDERARCPPWFSAVSAVSDRPGALPLRAGARICVARSDQPNDRSCRIAGVAHSHVHALLFIFYRSLMVAIIVTSFRYQASRTPKMSESPGRHTQIALSGDILGG